MKMMTNSINDKILELLMNDEEITWQSILSNLIHTEGLDPWDLDIVSLSDKFIETIKKLKELDFKISGKIVLAAAILLRIKSVYLVTNGVNNFDKLLQSKNEELEETEELNFENNDIQKSPNETLEKFGIMPKTPLPRKRKVSIYDLIDALQKAMDFKNKKITRLLNDTNDQKLRRLFEDNVDITVIISDLYVKISEMLKEDCQEILFDNLLCVYNPKQQLEKKDKVLTFLPLLYLETKQKIMLNQTENFGPISIKLHDGKSTYEDPKKEELKTKKSDKKSLNKPNSKQSESKNKLELKTKNNDTDFKDDNTKSKDNDIKNNHTKSKDNDIKNNHTKSKDNDTKNNHTKSKKDINSKNNDDLNQELQNNSSSAIFESDSVNSNSSIDKDINAD